MVKEILDLSIWGGGEWHPVWRWRHMIGQRGPAAGFAFVARRSVFARYCPTRGEVDFSETHAKRDVDEYQTAFDRE